MSTPTHSHTKSNKKTPTTTTIANVIIIIKIMREQVRTPDTLPLGAPEWLDGWLTLERPNKKTPFSLGDSV